MKQLLIIRAPISFEKDIERWNVIIDLKQILSDDYRVIVLWCDRADIVTFEYPLNFCVHISTQPITITT
jgi:hypothetical protein